MDLQETLSPALLGAEVAQAALSLISSGSSSSSSTAPALIYTAFIDCEEIAIHSLAGAGMVPLLLLTASILTHSQGRAQQGMVPQGSHPAPAESHSGPCCSWRKPEIIKSQRWSWQPRRGGTPTGCLPGSPALGTHLLPRWIHHPMLLVPFLLCFHSLVMEVSRDLLAVSSKSWEIAVFC